MKYLACHVTYTELLLRRYFYCVAYTGRHRLDVLQLNDVYRHHALPLTHAINQRPAMLNDAHGCAQWAFSLAF